MSIRVLGSTGKMFEVEAVIPTVEVRFAFNGRYERKIEIAKSLDENPNGLLLLRRANHLNDGIIVNGGVLEYIGNISTNNVREVLTFILADGFYNFSDWNYQKETEIESIILDGGKSLPYSSAITAGAIDWYITNPIRGIHKNDESILLDDANAISENKSAKFSNFMEAKEWDDEDFYDDTEEESGWDGWDFEE